MRFAAFLAALAMAAPVVVSAQTPAAQRPLIAELRRQCPDRHLENLTPGDLDLVMEDFNGRLTEVQKRAIQDTVGRRCALTEGGLSCANNATLIAYRRLGLLKAFVADACAQAKP